ncbi:alpha/beta hydrolase [Aurantimonas sp. A3-2-R12]|uniref:alpha/beta hydrolase n=1 Tax=Aurantimonas sp. A3-2-R12 TaxID=3114362 RepID=UPI002E17A3BB|nr:alpha/beta hydrolase [Aurantimonas sp. A3-2-R12]
MVQSSWRQDAAPLTDFDAAYANSAAIAGSQSYPPRWAAAATAFREHLASAGRARLDRAYGPAPRNRYDLFFPDGAPLGLVVFVHGGYWKAFDKSLWSHLAEGALQRGHAVAMPSYTLCPDATIRAITREIGAFLDHVADEVRGPIRLSGHSAGGHLVSRMLCTDAPIARATADRIDRTVSISGVHDLRPLLATGMHDILQFDLAEARAESPALLEPRANIDITCLVGGAELGEFRRQNALLANVWHGFGVLTRAVERPGKHHFDVIDELRDPASELVAILTGAPNS